MIGTQQVIDNTERRAKREALLEAFYYNPKTLRPEFFDTDENGNKALKSFMSAKPKKGGKKLGAKGEAYYDPTNDIWCFRTVEVNKKTQERTVGEFFVVQLSQLNFV